MDYDSPQTAEVTDMSLLTKQVQGSTADQSTTAGIELVNGKEAVAGEVLVSFRPGRAGKIPGIRNKMKAKELKVIPRIGVHRWRLESKQSVAQAIKQLSANPDVKYVEANYLVYAAATPNDPLQSKLWGLHNTGQTGGTPDADIDAPEAWNIATGSNQVVVGVIDTGVDYTHPDLAANIWTNAAERNGIAGIDDDGNGFIDDIYGWDFCNNDNDPYDDNSHGTHCAGTIGAVGNNGAGMAGVNWNVKIIALKFLDENGDGNVADAAEAIEYAIEMRQRGVNILLTSNSWGTINFSQTLLDAIESSRQVGMLFVAAAGNSNVDTDTSPNYPSCYDLDNIISVAATDHNDKRASFSIGSSNWGATTVDLAAPGVDIWSTIQGNGYAAKNGTSMAAPHVAGVAALAWSIAPGSSYIQIRDAILTGVDPINMDQPTVTGGRLNALGALSRIGMVVTGGTPAKGDIVVSPNPPVNFTIHFSFPVDRTTLQPADLKVNDKKANMFTVSHDNLSVTFSYYASPVKTQGLQKMYMLANAIKTNSTVPSSPNLKAWTATFHWDMVPMAIIGSAPMNASAIQLPFAGMTVTFNEPYNPASIDTEDLILNQGQVAEVVKDNPSQITYILSGIDQEGGLTVTIPAGAVTDMYGNPMQTYSASFGLDYGVVPFPKTLQPLAPLGSLIHEGKISGSISQDDTDSFQLTVDAGQAMTIIVTPDESLCPTLGLSSGWTNKTVPADNPGQAVVLQLEPTANALSTHTFSISGLNTTGNYTLEVLLNSAVEQESLGGSRNDDMLSAQNIDSAFIDLNDTDSQRTSICGRIEWEFTTFQAIEDFEDQNLMEYLSPTNNFMGFSVVPAPAAHDGTYGLQAVSTGWIYRNDPSVYLEQGSRISAWIYYAGQPAGKTDMLYFGFGASAAGTLSAVMAPGTNELFLQRNLNYATYEYLGKVSQQWLPDHWYKIEVDWRQGGDIIMDLYDSDGTTLLNSVSGADTTILSGGIAFRAVGSTKFIDTVKVSRTLNADPDFYSVTLSAGQSITAMLETAGDNAVMELYDSAGILMASSTAYAANVDMVIKNFAPPAAGTYYIKIKGQNQINYKLMMTRGGTFDLEFNDNIVSAQDITSRNAVLGHIGTPPIDFVKSNPKPKAPVRVGYYTDFYPNSEVPEQTILLAEFIPVQILDIAAFDFSTIEILMVNEPSNYELSIEMQSRLNDIEAWVRSGGIFIVHDRFVSTNSGDPQPNPFLVGASGILVDRDLAYGNDIDIITPGTLVTDGYYGAIDDNNLDSENFSCHGFALGNTLPAGSAAILSAGPAANNKVTAFSYGLDKGFVYYAAIPLDYFLAGIRGDAFRSIYAPNLLLYMNSLKPDEDWYRLTVNPWSNTLLETRIPADGQGEFVNPLDPMIRVYDAAGVLLGAADNNAPDGRNASISVAAENQAVDYFVQIASSELADPTRGTYVLSQKIYTESKIVRINSITYSTTGGKNQDKHLLVTIDLKDNFGSPVANASVSATLMLNGVAFTSWTATTGIDGKLTYTYNNARPGTYTTVITDINAADLTWDGITPANSFTKK